MERLGPVGAPDPGTLDTVVASPAHGVAFDCPEYAHSRDSVLVVSIPILLVQCPSCDVQSPIACNKQELK